MLTFNLDRLYSYMVKQQSVFDSTKRNFMWQIPWERKSDISLVISPLLLILASSLLLCKGCDTSFVIGRQHSNTLKQVWIALISICWHLLCSCFTFLAHLVDCPVGQSWIHTDQHILFISHTHSVELGIFWEFCKILFQKFNKTNST